jgi:hypothetical protein
MQLSVSRYKAIAVGRGANLDTLDMPLNSRTWLERQFEELRRREQEQERLSASMLSSTERIRVRAASTMIWAILSGNLTSYVALASKRTRHSSTRRCRDSRTGRRDPLRGGLTQNR